MAGRRHLVAKPIDRATPRDWFREAEDLAKVYHVVGRAFYGVRRVAVDAALAEGISLDGLEQHGG